jgi:hypothetical protein
VHFLKANNFVVDWHLKFEVNLGEKCVGTGFAPVHWRREKSQVGMQILPNPLNKTPISLCESWRGILDLHLCYLVKGVV